MKFRRGFKSQAESVALKVRSDLGLLYDEQLDPRALAQHLGIQVVDLEELMNAGMAESSVRHLVGDGRSEFSAALFQCGNDRLIVANVAHSRGRQASNVVHEIAHLVLKHEPPEGVLELGCRHWDAQMEGEADWLAGEILVPRRAAVEVARRGTLPEVAAQHFGVSAAMMNWRLNHSGARKQVARERAAMERKSWL